MEGNYPIYLSYIKKKQKQKFLYKKTNKAPCELKKDYVPNLNYLKVWECLVKVMLLEPKKRKIGSKTSNCILVGYGEYNVAYKFLVLKSDIFDYNIIIETKECWVL